MAISSPGIGSGLDINSIVTKLVALEKQPVALLQAKGTGLQAKLSAYGQIKSGLATLDDASKALVSTDTWKGRTFTSDNTAITGSVATATASGTLAVNVTALAEVQSVQSSTALASTWTAGVSGRIDISLGERIPAIPASAGPPVTALIPASFTATSTVSVAVTGTETLSEIADKITAANGGVTAQVITGSAGNYLAIRSDSTGKAAGFQVNTYLSNGTEITDGTNFGAIAVNSGLSVPKMTVTEATNAALTINGIAVSSATNTVANAVTGLTLNLSAITSGTVTIGVDKDAVKTKIEAFRTAYNSIRTTLHDLTKYDAATKTGGPLLGDSTAVGLEKLLREKVFLESQTGSTLKTLAGKEMKYLSDVGLQMQRDGTLTTNSSKLDDALGNLTDLKTFFTYQDPTINATTLTTDPFSVKNGIARLIGNFAHAANTFDGSIYEGNQSLQKAISRNTTDIDKFNARVAQTETRLYAQFSRLDANIGTLNGLGTFVSQQIAQWNKTG
jgi:flagellar hook-associated protein 2